MANIDHDLISDPYIHEPKGASTATVNKVYVANGSGSGVWKKIPVQALSNLTSNGTAGQVVSVDGAGNFQLIGAPHGQVDFYNLSVPYTLTYPSVYTKLAPTTVAGGVPSDFTEDTTARLIYTGVDTVPISVTYSVSIDQASGADRDIIIAIYKNGSIANGRSMATTSTGKKTSLSGTHVMNMSTNDYIELFVLNNGGSGDVRLYAMQINAIFAGA